MALASRPWQLPLQMLAKDVAVVGTGLCTAAASLIAVQSFMLRFGPFWWWDASTPVADIGTDGAIGDTASVGTTTGATDKGFVENLHAGARAEMAGLSARMTPLGLQKTLEAPLVGRFGFSAVHNQTLGVPSPVRRRIRTLRTIPRSV